jgi:hypothetical protein
MFGLRSVGSVTLPSRRPSVRPSLEPLERRCVPTAILTIGVKYEVDREIILAGNLCGVEDVSNVTITLSGVVSGTTTTDSEGDYFINLTATGLGMVYAEAAGTDATAAEELWDITPVILGFAACEGPNHVWTFTGSVRYRRDYTSMTINFGGVPINLQNQSTEMTDGTFEWLVTLNGTAQDNGLVWAQAVSPWGTPSEKAYDNVWQTGT